MTATGITAADPITIADTQKDILILGKCLFSYFHENVVLTPLLYRCYVGSISREQWRPCSDSYHPYDHKRRAPHWPISYVHKQGPPNNTTRHQSIVDNFLESLHFEKEHNYNLSAAATGVPHPTVAPYSNASPHNKNSSSSSVLEFQVYNRIFR